MESIMWFRRKKIRVAQILPSFADRDAIGKQVRVFNSLLSEMGFEVHVYAKYFPQKFKKFTSRLEEFEKDNLENSYEFAIFHFSNGTEVVDYVKNIKIPIILYYHNITPAKYLKSYSDFIFEELTLGRKQLKDLVSFSNIKLAVGVSDYNEKELKEAGFKSTNVFPIVFDFESLGKIGIDKKLEKYLDKEHITNITFIGRFFPHKGQRDIIRAFYIYNKYFNAVSRLNLIGNMGDMEHYVEELRSMTKGLGIESAVDFYSLQDDRRWKTFFTNSDIFISMSEHEGFFVPALEANYFGLPLIAYNAGAISDTVGDGGIVLDTKKPEVTAEVMGKILNEKDLREQLIKNGFENYRKYEYSALRDRFFNLISDFRKQYLSIPTASK